MLFLVKDLRVLILVSCCHVYLCDLALKRLVSVLRDNNINHSTSWFFGAYELDWLLASGGARYCAYIVLGFVLKGVSAHNVYIASSVYQSIIRYPVVNLVHVLDYTELGWRRAFWLSETAIIIPLKTVLGVNAVLHSDAILRT